MVMVFSKDLRKKDFSGLDLHGALFEDADLYGVRFVEANLEGASFQNCFAAEADFTRARGSGLRATKTNFYGAKLCGAVLEGAVLHECVLASADLRGASLRGLTLTLDCNSFEEVRLNRSAGAELAYLFGRAQSPQRSKWLDVIGEEDLARLRRVFER
jgi:uncharacterized protein YjbI with pentapeptide repeats